MLQCQGKDDFMQQIIKEINNHIDVRKNTVKLKKIIQEHPEIKLNIDLCRKLLNDEDWKVRKNTCSIIALSYDEMYCDLLFDQYSKENNYIVKVEMIETLSMYSYNLIGERFEMILANLLKLKDENNDRHIQTMISTIVTTKAKAGKIAQPVFTDLKKDTSVVLTCLECNQDLLFNRVIEPKKRVNLGVMVKINEMRQIAKYRDYEEALFLLTNFKDVPFEYEAIANALEGSNLLTLLDSMHEANQYLFRIDTSHVDPAKTKNEFVQKLSMAIQSRGKQRLFNSSSNYSIELQLREMKNNKVRVFLKLYTYEDPRFRYRQEITSGSMAPYLAGSIIQLIKPYLVDKADVLDLCCGTGTLLIERCFEQKAHFVLGCDIFGQAIEAAKKNTKITHMDIHYVNRDFTDFKHDHLFDEIISDLPISSTKINYDRLEDSYRRFMRTALKLLKKDGYMFLYTTEHKSLRKILRFNQNDIMIKEEIHITLKNTEAVLFILQRL